MPVNTLILVVLIIVSLMLIALFILNPSFTRVRLGKILAFIAFFILPILTASTGASEHVRRSTTTNFCLSCHTMDKHGKSLLIDDRSFIPAVHYQNHLVPQDKACFTCHTDYTLYGDFNAKLRGLRHVYVQYLGKPPEEIKLYTPYNNRECLHCHLGARSFEEGATHNSEPETLKLVKENKMSCSTSGCHNTVHNVKGLSEITFWQESGSEKAKEEPKKEEPKEKKP